jgi:hypothetical protein
MLLKFQFSSSELLIETKGDEHNFLIFGCRCGKLF